VSLVEALFGLLGLVALGSALLVVTTRQLVHAALWLVVTLGSIAGCYLLLSAEFVAWVQVLIYVGAVVVLLLFGLMLTRAPIGVSADLDGPPMQRVAAAVVALGLAGIVVVAAVEAFGGERIRLGDDRVAGSSASAGAALFRAWVLPFEVLSVLLLAALVGAIVLSRRDIGGGEGARD
jgi:NADH-quinone oxidoreductase subunit J